MIGALPEVLTVGGDEYQIRSDYRNILQVFQMFQDPDYEDTDKWIMAIYLIFEDFSCGYDVLEAVERGFDITEAQQQISWFISAGHPEKEVLEKPVYDWLQDEQVIFSAVNKVAGKETRELEYLHWWTFLGYFNEVGEGNFSFIVGIRDKLNKGKKLEKHEREFLNNNKELVELVERKTKEEIEKKEEYNTIWKELV